MQVLQHPVWRWPLLFAAWTLLALSFAAQFYISSSQAGLAVGWRQALGGSLGDWYVVAILTWPALALARHFTFVRGQWAKAVLTHGAAAVLFSAAFIILRTLVAQWQGWAAERPVGFGEALRPLVVKTWHYNLIIYAVIVAVAQAIRFYRESQERAVSAIELERRLAEARLMALQMQLNPHFLFNALNSIATLVHREPRAADRMLVRLAELLRMTLDTTTAQEIPLRAELALLERYLDIERIRFGDRLEFSVEAGPDTHEALVPTLLLQPIVENALKHGLGPVARPGSIRVRASRDADQLRIEVQDNGAGLPPGREARDGIGLANTRARLQHLHGDRHRLTLDNAPENGVVVTIELPFHTAPAES